MYSFVLKWINGLRQWLGQFSVRDSLIALSLSTSPTIQSSKHNIVGHLQIPITNLGQALNALGPIIRKLISHLLQGAPQQARLSIFCQQLETHIGSNNKYLAPTSFSFPFLERTCIERNRTLCGHHREFLHYPPCHWPNYKRLSATPIFQKRYCQQQQEEEAYQKVAGQ